MQKSSKEPTAGFEGLGLSPLSLEAIKKAGYKTPSPIQSAFIPKALAGGDCTGQARTGTGKTAAFMFPIFEQIDCEQTYVQAIVLTPTRELSEQVAAEGRKLACNRPARIACCVGGKFIKRQIEEIQKGAQVIVGTPGRILDLMSRRILNFDKLKVAVLDEADRMLDIGFRPDIEKILRHCPTERQTLLLSATMPDAVERLAKRYMRNPDRVDLSQDQVMTDTVQQFYVTVDAPRKFKALVQLLIQERPQQAIVFCRTKRGADKLFHKLGRRLPNIAQMHGDLQQSARDRSMKAFRDGSVRMLIATDVVGRGIDVTGVSHIINYDVPEFCDDYVHRVGRTGRLSSGEKGFAFTFVTIEEGEQLTNIEKRINRLLPAYVLQNGAAQRDASSGDIRDAIAAAPPAPVASAEPISEVVPSQPEEDPWAWVDDFTTGQAVAEAGAA